MNTHKWRVAGITVRRLEEAIARLAAVEARTAEIDARRRVENREAFVHWEDACAVLANIDDDARVGAKVV